MARLLRSLAILFFVVLLHGTASAQFGSYGSNTWVGLRGGVGIGSLSLDSVIDGVSNGSHTGFFAGLQIDHWFDDAWAVSVQALYDQKGGHQDFSSASADLTASGTSDEVTSYLDIPVLIKRGFGEAMFVPYAFVGPQFGIPLSGKRTDNFNGVSTTTDVKAALQSVDISVLLGLGVQDRITKSSMAFVDLAYAIGVTSIVKAGQEVIHVPTNTPPSAAPSTKTGEFKIGVGVLWKI